MEPHRKGDLTEAIVIAELLRYDVPVSIPFGDNERYDVVVETREHGFLRVQVKTGWLYNGTVTFHGKSQHTNSQGNVYKDYDGDVDCFLVYCHDLDQLYVVSNDEFDTSISLRVEEPDVVHDSINWAADYEFEGRWPVDAPPPT